MHLSHLVFQEGRRCCGNQVQSMSIDHFCPGQSITQDNSCICVDISHGTSSAGNLCSHLDIKIINIHVLLCL